MALSKHNCSGHGFIPYGFSYDPIKIEASADLLAPIIPTIPTAYFGSRCLYIIY